MELSKEYKKALEDAHKYKPEENKEEITGFTKYSGQGKSDKQYPILFNFIISLLLQIIEKLNKIINILEDKKETEKASDIEKITEAINKLNIEDIKIDRKPKPYKHWLPRK